MKAVKLLNIEWELSSVPAEERAELLKKLPDVKGYFVDDDYNVAKQAPKFLMKKYGYAPSGYNFVLRTVAEDIESLLKLANIKVEKGLKDIFHPIKGVLTTYGKACYAEILSAIDRLYIFKEEGTLDESHNKLFEEVLIGIGKVLELDIEEVEKEEVIAKLDELIAAKKRVMPKKKRKKKSVFEDPEDDEEMDEDEMDEDEDEDEVD